MSEISGVVSQDDTKKNVVIKVTGKDENGAEVVKSYSIPFTQHARVMPGDRVEKGDIITREGVLYPQDILAIKGLSDVQNYLISEDVYKRQAISLAHDLGHTPFGHAGESALDKLCPEGFRHYMQSLRVVDKLEKDGQGLNLTWEVRNGIVTHTKGIWAATPEGRIVRMADQIAYVNHDIEDAVRAGVLDPATLPKDCTAVLGQTKSARITTMINSILAHSDGDVGVGAEENEAFLALRDFMYATVYVDKTAKAEEQKVDKVIGELYEYYLAHVDQMSNFYVQLAYQDNPERAVTDYISGMSDEFAIRTFEDVFVPRKWHVL